MEWSHLPLSIATAPGPPPPGCPFLTRINVTYSGLSLEYCLGEVAKFPLFGSERSAEI